MVASVDPSSGLRDLNLPLMLRQNYGHIDCGVLLRVERRHRSGRPDARSQ
jgi:hypothetical protein